MAHFSRLEQFELPLVSNVTKQHCSRTTAKRIAGRPASQAQDLFLPKGIFPFAISLRRSKVPQLPAV